MKTTKLFENPYLKAAKATILAIEDDGLILDATIFNPEGGGQEPDAGSINGIPVTDVQEKGEVIHHQMEDISSFTLGQQVDLLIDWEQRFHNMQQHSGEHILSGLARTHYQTENVGFHIGEDMMRVDYDKELNWEDLAFLERESNRAIIKNLPIVSYYPEERDEVEFRFKKEIEEQLRIVEVQGVDTCACCGTHVAHTGEVGLLKIITREKYKGGVRLGVLCGFRAIDYFDHIEKQSQTISQLLCAPAVDLVPALEQVMEDRKKIKEDSIRKDQELIRLKVQEQDPEAELLILFEDLLEGKSFNLYLTELALGREGLVALFTPQNEGYRFSFVSHEDIGEMGQAFLEAFDGRGGGRGQNFQGWITGDSERIEEWLKKYMSQK